jgi:mycothiol synthase
MSTYAYRPVTLDDVEELAAVQTISDNHDGRSWATTPRQFEELLLKPHVDLGRDTIAAIDSAGMIVGFGFATYSHGEGDDPFVQLSGSTHPAHRNRGLGSHMIAHLEVVSWDHLERNGVVATGGIRTFVFEGDANRDALLAEREFSVARIWNEMSLTLPSTIEPRTLEGVTIVGWNEVDVADLYEVEQAAFRGQYAVEPLTFEEWVEYYDYPGFRPDLSFVAVDDDGDVLGLSWNYVDAADFAISGRKEGWIGQLAVSKTARGRGIGSCLCEHSFAAFRHDGLVYAMLTVDTDSTAGALSLYEGLGFERIHASSVYEKDFGSGS